MELIDHHLPKGVTNLKLAPVGDIQFGASGCAEHMLQRHIEFGLEHGWKFLGMGDYLDHFSPSNRLALVRAKGSLYESAIALIEEAMEERVKKLAAGPLRGSEGHWLGLIQGDHEYTFEDGQPSDAMLAAKLKAPYMGHSAIVRVFAHGSDRPLRIFVTHGRGASTSPTGKTPHLERMGARHEADIVLMGHAHLKYGYRVPLMKWRDTKAGPKLVHESRVLGITGSFLKGYEERTSTAGWPSGSYVEQGAMAPVVLGGLLIEANLVKNEWGDHWDMFVTS